jgi:hypothetical protein
VLTSDTELGRVMDVTMLGPRGAGKTSLLTSLFDQFQAVIGTTPLELFARNHATQTTLEIYRQELHEFARGVLRDPGIAGTAQLREYIFGLGTQGKRPPQMHLRFTDAPGGLLTTSGPLRDRLDAAVGRSGVLLLAVDSPALMEENQAHHDRVNTPELVMEFVRDALAAGGGQRLVIVVPLKCEKYMASARGAQELSDAVKQRYRTLIKNAANLSIQQQAPEPTDRVLRALRNVVNPYSPDDQTGVGMLLAPVQTVGSMRFSRFEPAGDGFREIFMLRQIGGSYSPRDADQPLRWMLRFAVNAYKDRSKNLFEWVVDWWNETDVKLTSALERFAADCKVGDGFEILVPHPYLDRT